MKLGIIIFYGVPGSYVCGRWCAQVAYENILKTIVEPNMDTHKFMYAVSTEEVSEEFIRSIYNKNNKLYKLSFVSLQRPIPRAYSGRDGTPYFRIYDFIKKTDLSMFDLVVTMRIDATLSRPIILADEYREKDFINPSGSLVRPGDFHNRDHSSVTISDVSSLTLWFETMFFHPGPSVDLDTIEKYKKEYGLKGDSDPLEFWNCLHEIVMKGYNYKMLEDTNLIWSVPSCMQHGKPWPLIDFRGDWPVY
jgi:hypothetical protein